MTTYATLTNRRTAATTRIELKTRNTPRTLFATARQFQAAIVRVGAQTDRVSSDTSFAVCTGARVVAEVHARGRFARPA